VVRAHRRWAVLLVIILLAALAPSTALAAKPAQPVDAITKIEWVAGPGYEAWEGHSVCSTKVVVTFTVAKGSPRDLYAYYRSDTNNYYGALTGGKAERDGNQEIVFFAQNLESYNPRFVMVLLYTKKEGTVASAQVPEYAFPANGCEAEGTALTTFVAP
jgi:hypothetical protein